MKTILCILALLALTASTADAYVRRTVAGAYAYPGYYGGYAVSRRPTPFPRYSAGNYGVYHYGAYPYGYVGVFGGPILFLRYYGW